MASLRGIVTSPVRGAFWAGKSGVKGIASAQKGWDSMAVRSSRAYTSGIGQSAFMKRNKGLNQLGATVARHPIIPLGLAAGGAMQYHGGSRRPDRRWANGRSAGRYPSGHPIIPQVSSGLMGATMPRSSGGYA